MGAVGEGFKDEPMVLQMLFRRFWLVRLQRPEVIRQKNHVGREVVEFLVPYVQAVKS